MKEQITALRREMKSRGIFAYIVMTEDFHGSEYVGEYFKLREYLSGFTGSAGTLVVTEDRAALWTDGRYFIQAAAELSGSGIDLMKQGEPETPSITDFLRKEMPENSVLGFDGRAVRAAFALNLQRALSEKASRSRRTKIWAALCGATAPRSRRLGYSHCRRASADFPAPRSSRKSAKKCKPKKPIVLRFLSCPI